PSVEEQALLFMEAHERVKKMLVFKVAKLGLRDSVLSPGPAVLKLGIKGMPPISKGVESSGLKCFNCGEPGYRQSECKKAGKRHLFANEEWEDNGVANDNYEEPPVFHDDQYEEEIVSGDVGVNLMVRRSCLTTKALISRAKVPVKMPLRRNRPLTVAYEQEFEQRVMARIEERLD
ncbi:putative reverse transcriptase domain-containing protein, partial [Tanacetum coccineum]